MRPEPGIRPAIGLDASQVMASNATSLADGSKRKKKKEIEREAECCRWSESERCLNPRSCPFGGGFGRNGQRLRPGVHEQSNWTCVSPVSNVLDAGPANPLTSGTPRHSSRSVLLRIAGREQRERTHGSVKQRRGLGVGLRATRQSRDPLFHHVKV